MLLMVQMCRDLHRYPKAIKTHIQKTLTPGNNHKSSCTETPAILLDDLLKSYSKSHVLNTSTLESKKNGVILNFLR